ncbi:helix-turn-helix domain-containing protein [Rhodocyclus tenuis]|nr:helix-turn-helix domain-containing protein [Rhodocyclus gracilis]
MHKVHFGTLFRSERVRLGLSQQQAAEAIGVRREMIGRYERDEAEPGVSVVLRFCDAGADPMNLFPRGDARAPSSAYQSPWLLLPKKDIVEWLDAISQLAASGIEPIEAVTKLLPAKTDE